MEQPTAVTADQLTIRVDDETELRTIRLEDVDELYALIKRNCTRLHSWLAWATPDYSRQDTHRFVSEHVAENAEGVGLMMKICHKGNLCGAIELHRIDRANKSSSIGYWIDEGHQGKGIITGACRAIITEGFRRFGLHRVEIRCATWNHRSSAIPRRLEFVEEGILREAERLHDRWVDLRVFSMLAQDWK